MMKIKTNVFESGLIEQETLFNDHGLVGQMTRKLIDTNESQIREALIKLGWVPPESVQKVMALLLKLELRNDDVSNTGDLHVISQCVVGIRKELLHHD